MSVHECRHISHGKKYFNTGRHVVFCVAVVCVLSCNKPNLSVYTKVLESPVQYDLHSIRRDSAGNYFIAAGNEMHGTLLQSNDGGRVFHVYGNTHYHNFFDCHIESQQHILVSGADVEFAETYNGTDWQVSIPPEDKRPKTGYLSDLYSLCRTPDGTLFTAGGEKNFHGVIYKSTDWGKDFSLTYRDHELRKILFADNKHGVATGYGAIYFTNDKGESWNLSNAKNDFFTGLCLNKGNWFCCSFEGGIYSSHDNGQTWKQIDKGNKPFKNRYHYNCIVFAPDGLRGIAAGESGCAAITIDGGSTWQEGQAFGQAGINDIIFCDNDLAIAVANKGKIIRFTF